MPTNWPKCPKCGKDTVEIIEVWKNHTISWYPGMKYGDGILDMGDSDHVNGHCISCDYRWRFRIIIQANPDWFTK